MPRILFEKLQPEKKEKLIDAAVKEFSSKPYEEASINSIIKHAKIARGSFYLYFVNKEDLYFYVLERYLDYGFNKFKTLVFDKDKDIFEKMLLLFDKIISIGEEASLFLQIIINMKWDHNKIFVDVICKRIEENNLSYNFKEDAILEKTAFRDMALNSFNQACHSYIVEKEPFEKVKELLKTKLNILKEGVKNLCSNY